MDTVLGNDWRHWDSWASSARHTVFQASPRHNIPSIASVIADKNGDRRTIANAHGSIVTVRIDASITDALSDSNPHKASAASTVISIGVSGSFVSSRPLFAAYNRQSFPRRVLNSTAFLQVQRPRLASFLACDVFAQSCKRRNGSRPTACAFQGLCCIQAFCAQIAFNPWRTVRNARLTWLVVRLSKS